MSDWQPAATALAGGAAIAVFVFSVIRERHPLAAVERLAAAANAVRMEAVRKLLEDERDERATTWVLQQRAPRETGLRHLGITLRCLGGVALGVWLLGAVVDRTAAWACDYGSFCRTHQGNLSGTHFGCFGVSGAI
jgi:hypothetical protein